MTLAGVWRIDGAEAGVGTGQSTVGNHGDHPGERGWLLRQGWWSERQKGGDRFRIDSEGRAQRICHLFLLFFLIVVKHTEHKIDYLNQSQRYSSVALSTFIFLRNHHHCPSPELFKSCNPETLHPFKPLPLPSPQPLATPILFSVSEGLTSLSSSCEGNHAVLVLPWLAHFM